MARPGLAVTRVVTAWTAERLLPIRISLHFSRDAEPAAELVIDKVAEEAPPVALKPRLTIELRRNQPVPAAGGEDIALPCGVADQHVVFATDDHGVVRTLREPVLAHEFVEHTGLHVARERRRGAASEEWLHHAPRQTATQP